MGLKEAIARVNKEIDAVEKSKKLTTKDRKDMKAGTFCGPNRSFPVNDCKHASTAKSFLKRSKFSQATKKRIAACINRKAKSMGCPAGKPAKADIEIAKKLEDAEIFKTTRELVEQSLENEGMELDFANCEGC